MKSSSKGVAGTAAPGDVIVYWVTVFNSGTGDALNVVLDDDLSGYTAWGVNTYGAGQPFSLVQEAPDPDGAGPLPPFSGVTLGTPVFYDKDDNIITPTAAADGFDVNVERWILPMSGNLVPGGQFKIEYQVKVE